MRRAILRPLATTVAAILLTVGLPGAAIDAKAPGQTAAREIAVAVAVAGEQLVRLPMAASHLALHWRGQPDAHVSVSLSQDGLAFGNAIAVEHDEIGEGVGNGETYGAILASDGARFVLVRSDRPLGRVSVLSLDARGPATAAPTRFATAATTTVEQPAVISRAGWGADESLRFDSSGAEKWTPAFYPIQKMIVHHTAGRNGDPDPAATIRAIYYYHAITQGWGDIGYNFLIDEAGRVYEGRYSRTYAAGESPTGEDTSGNGVTAAHVVGFNSGTVGVSLLGTLTSVDATPAARDALERILAWKADRHAIDPTGDALYTNPVNGTQKTFPNISGHRDLAATECPGGTFYATLPALRDAVATRIGSPPPPPPAATVPAAPVLSGSAAKNKGVTLSWTQPADGGSALTSYRVYRATGSGTAALLVEVGASTRTWRDRAVKRGTAYNYTVSAVNAIGEGGRSGALRITAK